MSTLPIHFSHANGIPSLTYSYLFEMMSDLNIHFIERMGYEGDVQCGDWAHLADELIASIEAKAHGSPVIGMGHSAGAVVTLMAACQRPELFEKVILLDPVLFSRRKRLALKLVRRLGLGDRMYMIKRTLARRSHFDNHQQAFDYFSPKSLFKNFHSRCFADYVKHGLKPADQGYELAICPKHEAEIFAKVLTKVPSNINKVQGVMIYGDKSDALNKTDVNWWHKRFPHFEITAFDGGHLFPLEQPEKVAAILQQAIA